jgi:hypothetical protein
LLTLLVLPGLYRLAYRRQPEPTEPAAVIQESHA